MPLDPAVVRDNLLDYGARTFWALVVAAISLLIARGVRGVTMRALARNRAQANVTVLVGNLAQLTVIAIGALLILAIYTQGAFAWILTSFSVVGIVIGLSAQDILKNFFAGVWVLIERPFRIPLHADVRAPDLLLPVGVALVQVRVEVADARRCEGAAEGRTGDAHGEHPLLSRLGGPARAVHHPGERGLDPGHAVERERGDEGSRRHCRVGDLGAVRLVDGEVAVVEGGAHLAFRW